MVWYHESGLTEDVREPAELQQEGKIPNAINLPLSSLQESLNLSDEAFLDKFPFCKPEKDKALVNEKLF